MNSFTKGAAITPSDSTDLSPITRSIYVGGTGDVSVKLAGDPSTTVTFKSVPVGTILPIKAIRVLSTGTTATFLISLTQNN